MLFKTADNACTRDVMRVLAGRSDSDAIAMPEAASSLSLSLLAEEVTEAGVHSSSQPCRKFILNLVPCGASLLISMSEHLVLYRKVQDLLKLKQTPWWLGPEGRRDGPATGVFRRLMCCGGNLERSKNGSQVCERLRRTQSAVSRHIAFRRSMKHRGGRRWGT